MVIGKKFSKFYLNTFQPITKLEENDIKMSRNFYKSFTIGGALMMGYISFKLRRIRIGAAGNQEYTARQNELAHNIINDAMMGVAGFFIGHFISCDYMYKNRQYVLQRMEFEHS